MSVITQTIDNKASIETFTNFHGQLCARGFIGKKSWFCYAYKTEEARTKAIADYVAGYKAMLERRVAEKAATRAAAIAFRESLVPGTVLYSSWGYEQTNVSFYVVVNKAGATVTLQRLAITHVKATSWASAMVTPTDERVGEPFKKIVRGAYGIPLDRSETLYVWDGKPRYCSWYA